MRHPDHLADRLLDEGLLPLDDALAAAGIQVAPQLARRWARSGSRGVRLEAIELDARLHTSTDALRRFLRARVDVDEARRRGRRATAAAKPEEVR